MKTLQILWESAYRAHTGTSFSPERRADRLIADYSEELDEDLVRLGEKQGNYKEKYIKYISAWLHAKSNCISTMITGGSNFPVRKAQKANQSEDNHYQAFRHWREKYFKAVERVKTLSPEEELEKAYEKLDKLIIMNELIIDLNKVIKKYKANKATIEDIVKSLEDVGFKDNHKNYILKNIDEKWFIKVGTLATSIRREKEKIEIMKVRIQRKDTWQDIKFNGGYITIEDDRVKIFHDDKPDTQTIINLKKRGFKWSPNWKAWVRKHTGNALNDAKNIVNYV